MSSIFGGSKYASICGGSFRHAGKLTAGVETNAHREGFKRLLQVVSPDAFHNSDDRPDPPKCHGNTRVAVTKKIMDWVTGRIDTDTLILWLYGPAGAGKTAIARTIAELCEAQGLLLASFLFFRSDPKRNTMMPLVANIAYCVARVIPPAREHIEAVIEAGPLIFSYSVEVQFTKLVLEPLQLLADQGYFLQKIIPPLVVIDGLDECQDKDAQTKLIQLLSSSVARALPIKFLIVSRPEPHIKSAVTLAREQSTVSYLELNNDFEPDEDIRLFFTLQFHEIKQCHPIHCLWPSEQQIETLVRKASGQFIYASVVVRFANSPRHSPMRQLDVILKLRPPIHHDLPFAELDTLYTYILSCSDDPGLVQDILGVNDVLVWCDFRRCAVIESVLGLEAGDVRLHLSQLSSLLEIADDDQIRWHHSSFMDFLRTRGRSTGYCIDAQISNSLIVQWILQLFTSKDFNACREGIDKWWRLIDMDLASYLIDSLWTVELEYALERFSLSTYLDWLDHLPGDELRPWHLDFPEFFLNYLEDKEKPELLIHNSAIYLKHDISSINSVSPKSSREKFHLLSTVWFVLYKPFASQWNFSWGRFCVTLFGFDWTEIEWDHKWCNLMRNPTTLRKETPEFFSTIYGHIAETKRLVPQPILSQRLAHVAISCIQYLRRHSSTDTSVMQNQLLSWAVKSKRSPWLWRRRMRVISSGRQPALYRPTYSSLRQSRQTLLSKGIQSEKLNEVRHVFYIWTLDLLYCTLDKAMKSDELTRELSTAFIPSGVHLIFPRRVKRVREAVDAYLEKFSQSSLESSTVERPGNVRRSLSTNLLLPQNIVVANDNDPQNSTVAEKYTHGTLSAWAIGKSRGKAVQTVH